MGSQWGQPRAAAVPEYRPVRRWVRVPVCWPPLRAHWPSPSVRARLWPSVQGAAVAGGSGVLAAATGALAVAVGFAALVASGAAAASGTVVASGDDGAAVASGDETGPLESDEPPQATARRTKDTAIAAKNTSLGTGFRPPAALVKIRYNCYSLRVPDSLHLRPDPQRRRDGAGLRQGTGRGPRPGTRLLNLNYEWPMVLDAYSFILHRAPASMTLSGRGGLL